MAATESFLPDSVRGATFLGDCRPVNPHSQRLQVAAYKQVRKLALPKGKAKCKAKAKAKTKAKTKAKAKAKSAPSSKQKATVNPKSESAGKPKTAYGKAKDDYMDWPLG